MSYEELLIDKINMFNDFDKNLLLDNQDELIDKGVRKLTDALNSISFISTMNSCQGGLIPEEAHKHCPRTYVDFYVLDHKYQIANLLMTSLTSEFANLLECSITFESDFDFIDENTVVDNGQVNFRYKIALEENLNIYDDIIEKINEFKDNIEE